MSLFKNFPEVGRIYINPLVYALRKEIYLVHELGVYVVLRKYPDKLNICILNFFSFCIPYEIEF